jgi:hypothetical protein
VTGQGIFGEIDISESYSSSELMNEPHSTAPLNQDWIIRIWEVNMTKRKYSKT